MLMDECFLCCIVFSPEILARANAFRCLDLNLDLVDTRLKLLNKRSDKHPSCVSTQQIHCHVRVRTHCMQARRGSRNGIPCSAVACNDDSETIGSDRIRRDD